MARLAGAGSLTAFVERGEHAAIHSPPATRSHHCLATARACRPGFEFPQDIVRRFFSRCRLRILLTTPARVPMFMNAPTRRANDGPGLDQRNAVRERRSDPIPKY